MPTVTANLAALIFIALVAVGPGCRAGHSEASQDGNATLIEKTVQAVQQQIDTIEMNNRILKIDFDDWPEVERMRHEGFQQALKLLEQAKTSDFARPKLLGAEFLAQEDNSSVVSLGYIGYPSTVVGMYVVSANGDMLAQGEVKTIGSDDEKEFISGLLQIAGATVSKTRQGELPNVDLDPAHFAGELRVGLIESDGTKGQPVKAFIEKRDRRVRN